ncbi:MAG: alcohol dehydrogenase catalytic domain-containing protein, partial [Steroidobacteraceae bacterium]
MTAIEIREPGPPQVLRAVPRPVPQPQAAEVLIRVAAAGVNRPDILQRKGLYPPPPGASDIPGLEVAGEVIAAGPDVRDPAVGARVCALLA